MKTLSEEKPVMVRHHRVPGTPLTAKQRKNIDELLANPNREVDTSDIPELTEEFWKNAVRGRFYRPIKQG